MLLCTLTLLLLVELANQTIPKTELPVGSRH